jgi:hypothetical protein
VSIPEPAPNLLVTFAADLLAVGSATTELVPEVTGDVVAMADLTISRLNQPVLAELSS